MSDKLIVLPSKEIGFTFKAAATTYASVTFWKTAESTRVTGFIFLYDNDKKIFIVRVPEYDNAGALNDFLFQNDDPQFFFSLTLVNALYFFVAKVKVCNSNQAEFHIPERLLKVQRRQHLRLTTAINKNLWAELKHPHNSKDVLIRKLDNVSAGGAAIILNQEEAPLFPKDSTIQQLKLMMDIQVYIDEATVVRKQKIQTSEGSKINVGVIFSKIQPTAQRVLSIFVFNEVSKYLTKTP